LAIGWQWFPGKSDMSIIDAIVRELTLRQRHALISHSKRKKPLQFLSVTMSQMPAFGLARIWLIVSGQITYPTGEEVRAYLLNQKQKRKARGHHA
jgi:hypothetical protein